MSRRAFVTSIDEAPAVDLRWGRGRSVRLIGPETAGASAMDVHINEIKVDSGSGPLHYHAKTENAYIVLEGVVEITVEGEKHRAGPNSVAWIPPGLKHTVGNVGDTVAKVIEIYAPAGDDFHIVSE